MKFWIKPSGASTSKYSHLRHRLSLSWALGFTSFLILLLINSLRVPSALQNFWAEDGVVFYSDAINKDFPERLFMDSGGGGYLNLSGKIIAEFVRLFPIRSAPTFNFVFVNLFSAILLVVIYNQVQTYFKTRILLLLFLGFFIFVPIASFDSVATSINLHFFLFFALFLLIFTEKDGHTLLDHFIVVVTCLSDPLVILLVPAVAVSIILRKKLPTLLISYIFSLLIQVAFIFHFFGESTREIGKHPSFVKTAYLFMDRAVGSSFIPNWGFIDGRSFEKLGLSNILLLRFFVSLIVFLLILYLGLIARPLNFALHKSSQNFLVGVLVLTSIAYWTVAGLLFNPEPRYAIFPSLCLVLTVLVSLDSIVSSQKNSNIRIFMTSIVLVLFMAIFSSAFRASGIRNTNLRWSEQIDAGKLACIDSKLLKVEIRIPPARNDLLLSVNCQKLR